MAPRKKHVIKVDLYRVVREAVENGVGYGLHRSFKHTEDPERETMKDTIADAVMNELCEWISFDDRDEDEA